MLLALCSAAAAERVATLNDFEDATDLKRVPKSGDATLTLVAEHATSGKQSLRFTSPGTRKPRSGFDASWYSFGWSYPRDWSNASALAFDVYAEGQVRLRLAFQSGFAKKPYKLHYKFVDIPPRKATTVTVPLSELAANLDTRKMIAFAIWIEGPAEDVTFTVDHLRLLFPDEPKNTPRNVRISWTDDPRTTMTVTWETDFATGSVVTYGAGREIYRTAKGGKCKSLPGTPDYPNQVHTVTLKGLRPGTTYGYRCGNGKSWSQTFSFTTASADANAPFTFCVGGDTKDELKVGTEMFGLVAEQKPQFMLWMGDQTPRGVNRFQWDRWFDMSEFFAANVPIMTCTGDHEDDGQGFVNFTARNMLPRSPGATLSYSWDYGNCHFVALHYKPDRATIKWFDDDLTRNRKKWVIVYVHWPFYTSTEYRYASRGVQSRYGAIMDKHKVTLAFGGHGHVYERTKPVLNSKKDGPVASYAEGTCYITTGGMGADSYPIRKGNWWTAAAYRPHHFVRVDVTRNKLTITAIARDGKKVIDKFTIER